MTTATATATNHKTVYGYTCPDGATFSSGCVDHITVELIHDHSRSFMVRLICCLPHDVHPRVLAWRVVRFPSRKAMLAAFEHAE